MQKKNKQHWRIRKSQGVKGLTKMKIPSNKNFFESDHTSKISKSPGYAGHKALVENFQKTKHCF